jgi:hypothetical protein
VSTQRLGKALFDVGSYAAGGTFIFLLFCGGAVLWSKDASANPILNVVAWGLLVALVGGLLLMGVGYVLRETSEEGGPDLASRVQKLEAEVARLRAQMGLPASASEPAPVGSSKAVEQAADSAEPNAPADRPRDDRFRAQ